MLFTPLAAPQALPIPGPVAALIVDAQRRRIFAAGARSVAVVDADSGRLLATIRIGGVRSLALEPLGGHVFAGTDAGRISELDPDRATIVRSLSAGGAVGSELYDATTGRLYGRIAGRADLPTFDTRAFAAGATLRLPGGLGAPFVSDPVTHDFYVAEADRPAAAIVDPQTGAVRATFPTPGLSGARTIGFDDALGQVVITGANGALEVFDRAGTPRARLAVPAGIDACTVDAGNHVLACSGDDRLTFVQLVKDGTPQLAGSAATAGPALVALDTKTNGADVVQSKAAAGGVLFQRWSAAPAAVKSASSRR